MPDRRAGAIQFWVPGKVANHANGRVHWRTEASYRKRWRTKVNVLARIACDVATVDARAPKHVRLEAQTWNLFDQDGLRNALKPVVDGLRDAGLIHSDGPTSGHEFYYGQLIGRKDRGVTITITPGPAPRREGETR